MLHQIIDLQVPYEKAGIRKGDYQPTLHTYVLTPLTDTVRPAVLICPGGGYTMTADREAEVVALRYAAQGIHAFVLYYSVAPDTWPTALLEVAESVAIIRENAAQWSIDPNKIVVEGFSAGGHLTQSLGCFWNREFVLEPLGRGEEEVRPNGLILCYPVISSNAAIYHGGSFRNLLGDLPNREELLALTSLEKQMGPQNPPTFLWHTAADASVPVENSLVVAARLQELRIPFELHIFPQGPHGLSLSNELTADGPQMLVPEVQPWMELSIVWLKGLQHSQL